MRSALRPLALPLFRRLTLVRFVDELGDWLGEIALAVLVFDRTGSPMATAALFLALQFVPAFATPPLVARLESLPSRASLAGLNLAQAAAFAALAVLAPHFLLVPVIALAAVGSALAGRRPRLTRAAAAAVRCRTACCARGTPCSTSASPQGRPPGRRWRAWWSPRPGPVRPVRQTPPASRSSPC